MGCNSFLNLALSLSQLNLLCAPWTEELEDGGHDVLSHDPTWSDLAAPSIPDYCCDLVMNMAKGAGFSFK